jgi:septal ring factor EnvC (AmiA/AmiB activator)
MATVEAKMRELVATWQASPDPHVLKDWLSTELEKLVEMLRKTVAERKNTTEQVEAALVKVEEQLCHEHMCLQKEHETTQPGALEKLGRALEKAREEDEEYAGRRAGECVGAARGGAEEARCRAAEARAEKEAARCRRTHSSSNAEEGGDGRPPRYANTLSLWGCL